MHSAGGRPRGSTGKTPAFTLPRAVSDVQTLFSPILPEAWGVQGYGAPGGGEALRQRGPFPSRLPLPGGELSPLGSGPFLSPPHVSQSMLSSRTQLEPGRRGLGSQSGHPGAGPELCPGETAAAGQQPRLRGSLDLKGRQGVLPPCGQSAARLPPGCAQKPLYSSDTKESFSAAPPPPQSDISSEVPFSAGLLIT